MSVPVSSHGSNSNQELGPRAARCVAEQLMMSPFPCLLDDQPGVSQSGKRLVGVFGHPTRDALHSAAKKPTVSV